MPRNERDQVDATERRILENARKLERLEKEFLKFTYEIKKPKNQKELLTFLEESVRTATEAFTAKSEILEDFKDLAELRIQDRQVQLMLDSIRRGDKLYSIAFYENIGERFNAEAPSRTDEIATSIHDILSDKFDDLFSDFHSWFGITDYYFAKITIGPIISSSKVPPYLLSYFEEVKETYAFGQYRASIALCRALLEIALYEKLKKRGAFRNKDPKITSIDVVREDNLNRYINIAKREKILQKDSPDIAHRIRKAANDVLHIKDEEKKLDNKVVIDTILASIRIVEELYR